MDFAPPSYEASTTKNHWPLIGNYLERRDLFSSTLVCKAWHDFFAPHLWGNLYFRFSFGQDPTHDNAARFRRGLAYARPFVRDLSHTLHLVPGRDDHWVNIPPSWLRDMLELLPDLQSLIISKLVSLDHETLLMLGQSKASKYAVPTPIAMNNMRLLDITGCPNVTVTGLSTLLQCAPNLMYIDLSGSIAARNSSLLSSLQNLRHLKVLKLSSVGLRDENMASLASAIGLRVTALDLTSNLLTNLAIDTLISKCFVNQPYLETAQSSTTLSNSSGIPNSRKRHQRHVENVVEEVGYIRYLRDKLTQNFVNLLAIDQEFGEMGLRELLLSNNDFTADGISKLLSCVKLQLLDAATTPLTSSIDPRSPTQSPTLSTNSGLFPITSKIGMSNIIQSNLSYLRIPHTCISASSFTEIIVNQQPQSLDELVTIRQNRRMQRLAGNPFCVPLNLGRLKVLALSGVPETSESPDLSRFYISLIEECAKEEGLSRLEASLDYTLPPGQNQDMRALTGLKSFPLVSIVLELCQNPRAAPGPSGVRSPDSTWSQQVGAVTMDTDSEAFWSAGASDFSFFREDETGFWEENPRTLEGKTINYSSNSGNAKLVNKAGTYDLVERLSTFRKKAKHAYEAARARGADPIDRCGYWSGKITVLRP